MPTVVEIQHPLVQHHLSLLRSANTPAEEFRHLVQRLATLAAYEATHDLLLEEVTVQTPLTEMTGRRLRQRIGLIPILRAGLGMVEPILNLIPFAEVWHLGVYRDEATARPIEYYSKLPSTRPVDVGLVLDPMLATGGSAISALEALRGWGVPDLRMVSVIAAKDGIAAVQAKFPQVKIFVCAVDPVLNSRKYIVPGLGDAGDRIFNTIPSEG